MELERQGGERLRLSKSQGLLFVLGLRCERGTKEEAKMTPGFLDWTVEGGWLSVALLGKCKENWVWEGGHELSFGSVGVWVCSAHPGEW